MLDYRRTLLPTLVLVTALAAAACGPAGTTAAPSASAPAASGQAGPDGSFDFAKIQECLTAAGIAVPSGGSFALPSGGIPQRPSGSFAPPSGSFAPPSGGIPGGGFNDPAMAAALEACGITLPGAPANP